MYLGYHSTDVPAQVPASIRFTWDDPDTAAHSGGLRRLLDLEKVTFQTDGEGEAPGVLLLSYTSAGVHRDGPGHGPSHLLYNIGTVAAGHPPVW